MKALLDADILVYRVAFTTQEEDIGIAKWRMNELIQRILERTEATEYQCYLTASNDSTAFRKKVYPEYKANRKAPRPVHYEALREYLVNEYGAAVSTTIEADDAIGIDSNGVSDCIIVSIDKDLLQLPGKHYNFVKDEFQTVTKESGLRFFYKQLLKGDAADNIKGCPGIGEVKAERILNSIDNSETAWFDAVRNTYSNDAEMLLNGVCLWIMNQPFPAGIWSSLPYGLLLQQGMDNEQLSLLKLEDDTSEQFIQETSMDGKLPPGSNPVEAITIQEDQQH